MPEPEKERGITKVRLVWAADYKDGVLKEMLVDEFILSAPVETLDRAREIVLLYLRAR